MKIIQKEEFDQYKDEVISAIKSGKIIIYPTDTIYGIGCDATNETSVLALRKLKGRDETKPFSVIAPNKDWILEHFVVPSEGSLDMLPGPYTLILKPKNKFHLAESINKRDDTIGVRIPKHWFSEVINEADTPFVTTSVNLSNQKYMETIDELPEQFKNEVAYLIYEGEKKGVRSTLIDLTN